MVVFPGLGEQKEVSPISHSELRAYRDIYKNSVLVSPGSHTGLLKVKMVSVKVPDSELERQEQIHI